MTFTDTRLPAIGQFDTLSPPVAPTNAFVVAEYWPQIVPAARTPGRRYEMVTWASSLTTTAGTAVSLSLPWIELVDGFAELSHEIGCTAPYRAATRIAAVADTFPE